jgi:CO/xanthine dehydrogenase FAD-binding subunit
MTRQRAAERSSLLASRVPLITEALRWVGHAQIRNRGTVGGSMAHADPAAELPAVASALGAAFVIASQNGTRTLSSDEFFVGYLTTAIEPAEMLAEVRFPAMPHNAGWAFAEISRRHGDFALVGVAALVHIDGGQCHDVRLAFTGVGPTPVRVREAEAALEGQRPTRGAAAGQQGGSLDDALLREVGRLVAERVEPETDIQASAEYRKHIAGVLARRALTAAAARAGGAHE